VQIIEEVAYEHTSATMYTVVSL